MGNTRLKIGVIRAVFANTGDETFTLNVSKAISFNIENVKVGIEHDIVTNNEIITFPIAGVYLIMVEPHYSRTSGGGTDALNIYFQQDSGSGFVNISNSNIKVTVGASAEQGATSLTGQVQIAARDKIRVMVQVESSNLILDAFAAFGTTPNDVPLTSSILLNIVRVGN